MTIKMAYGPVLHNGQTSKNKFIGSNQEITLSEVSSNRNITITGNHNLLTVDINNGAIKATGNDCTLNVLSGQGRVKVIGNNNTVVLGEMVNVDCVNCIGNHSKVLRRGNTANTKDVNGLHRVNSVNVGRDYLSGCCKNPGHCGRDGSKNSKQSLKCPCQTSRQTEKELKDMDGTCGEFNIINPTITGSRLGNDSCQVQPSFIRTEKFLVIDHCSNIRTDYKATKST